MVHAFEVYMFQTHTQRPAFGTLSHCKRTNIYDLRGRGDPRTALNKHRDLDMSQTIHIFQTLEIGFPLNLVELALHSFTRQR